MAGTRAGGCWGMEWWQAFIPQSCTSTWTRPSLLALHTQVVFCKMSTLQARLYNFFLNSPAVVRACEALLH